MTSVKDHQGVTIAFDIDGTLFDPDDSAYQATMCELLAAMDLGLDESSAWNAYESLRLMGRAIERLGLRNPNHFRGHAETLASLFVLFADRSRLGGVSRLSPLVRDVMRESLLQLDEALPARGQTDWATRLASERRVRALLKSDVSLGLFRDEVLHVASRSPIAEWSAHYADIETRTSLHDPAPLLDALARRGANLAIISEGLCEVQLAKLARLHIDQRFADRALITQAAGQVAGLDELDRALAPFLDAPDVALDDRQREELSALWRVRCIAAVWATKGPWFFGRCLHALRADPAAPASALEQLACVPCDGWKREPLRFVMIGDRYDRDVAPLHQVVGAGGCLTIRLAAGRYAEEFSESELPADRRPSRSFSSWDAMANYLTDELSRDVVPEMISPPAIADESFRDIGLLTKARQSPFEAVRRIADAIARSKA